MIRQSERKSQIYCNLGSAFLAVANNPGAAVVLHTPRACSHMVLSSYWNIRRRAYLRDPELFVPETNNLFVTGISDREAIFGAEELLRQCLLDVIKLPGLNYIVVVAGCTAGVIGDDVAAVSKEIEEVSGIPVFVIAGAGFMSGHYLENNVRMLEQLLARFAPARPKKHPHPRTAMFLGENPALANEDNIREIKRLLRYFSFERIFFPPNVMNREDYGQLPDSDVIIPVTTSIEHFHILKNYAQKLAERYQALACPWNYPIGIEGTCRWLEKLGDALHEEGTAAAAVAAETKRAGELLARAQKLLQGKTYLFVIGFPRRYFDAASHIGTLAAAGMQLQAVILHNDLTAEEKAAHRRRLRELTAAPCQELDSYDEAAIAGMRGQADLVLTTTELINVPHQLYLSVQQVGIWGVENLLEKTIAAVQGSGRRIIYEY